MQVQSVPKKVLTPSNQDNWAKLHNKNQKEFLISQISKNHKEIKNRKSILIVNGFIRQLILRRLFHLPSYMAIFKLMIFIALLNLPKALILLLRKMSSLITPKSKMLAISGQN